MAKPSQVKKIMQESDNLFDQGRLEEALKLSEEALSMAPNDAEIHQSRGEILAKMNRHKEAIASYNRAIELNPDDWWHHLWKGDSLWFLGRIRQAHDCYAASHQRNPDSAAVLFSLAIAQAKLGNQGAVLKSIRKLARLRPEWLKKVQGHEAFEFLHDDLEFRAIVNRNPRDNQNGIAERKGGKL